LNDYHSIYIFQRMLAHSNSSSHSSMASPSGTDIHHPSPSSSSISTMSSVDMEHHDDDDDDELPKYPEETRGDSGQVVTSSGSTKPRPSKEEHGSEEPPPLIDMDPEARPEMKDCEEEEKEDNWSLFGEEDDYPMLEEDLDEAVESPIQESHDSSHFVGSSKEEEAVHRGESFVIPRPDSAGNFLHTSMMLQDAPTVSSENGSVRKEEEEEEERSDPSSGVEYISLGADILMEQSAITGKLTLEEDPSQDGHRHSPPNHPSLSLKSTPPPSPHAPSSTRLWQWVLGGLVSMTLSGIYHLHTERTHYQQELQTLRTHFQQQEQLYLKQLQQKDVQFQTKMNQLELWHVEEMANATLACHEASRPCSDPLPHFPWEEEDTSSNTFLDIQNCWVTAHASFEWGHCPKQLQQQLWDTVRHSRMLEFDFDSEKVYSKVSSWKQNVQKLSHQFAHSVLLPEDPNKLLDGSVFTDMVMEERR